MFRGVLTSLAAWLSGVTVLSMNEADLHQTRLVMRWITAVSHQTIKNYSSQLHLAVFHTWAQCGATNQ